MVHVPLSTTQSPSLATDWRGPKVGNPSPKTEHSLHHSVDRKHIFGHVKFGAVFMACFTKKYKSNKKCHFHGGMACPFLKAVFK